MDLRDIDYGLTPEIPSGFVSIVPNGSTSWTDEHVLYLRVLVLEGGSGSEMARAINKKFGTSFTRNAIIGKLHRLGIGMNPSPSTHSPRRKRESSSKRIYFQPTKGNELTLIEPEITCDPIPLLDLQPNSCRWPISGDARTTMFCGANKFESYSYCTRHCRMAYQAPKIRTAAEFELQVRRMHKMRQSKHKRAA